MSITVFRYYDTLQASETKKPGDMFHCVECQQDKPINFESATSSYGIVGNDMICFDCCAIRDARDMAATGKAVLYLTEGSQPDDGIRNDGKITNWPGTLRYRVHQGSLRKFRHPFARHAVLGSFSGPGADGKVTAYWRFKCIGDNHQIAHCWRPKDQATAVRRERNARRA